MDTIESNISTTESKNSTSGGSSAVSPGDLSTKIDTIKDSVIQLQGAIAKAKEKTAKEAQGDESRDNLWKKDTEVQMRKVILEEQIEQASTGIEAFLARIKQVGEVRNPEEQSEHEPLSEEAMSNLVTKMLELHSSIEGISGLSNLKLPKLAGLKAKLDESKGKIMAVKDRLQDKNRTTREKQKQIRNKQALKKKSLKERIKAFFKKKEMEREMER